MAIPLEDNFNDILGKAQRGFHLDDDHLARKAGIPASDLGRLQSGQVLEESLRRLARTLGLGEESLLAIAMKAWHPATITVAGVVMVTTPFHQLTVNAYLLWDPATREGAVFDTGTDAGGLLRAASELGVRITQIFLTHTHRDHVADLERVRAGTGAPVWVGEQEPVPGAATFGEGKEFQVGRLRVEARQTSGHSVGGMTYVVSGLACPVAVVGDALFAGSMGGGAVSYVDALRNNRKKILTLPDQTVLCPGHGPMTTVGEEKRHNPFFPEFQQSLTEESRASRAE